MRESLEELLRELSNPTSDRRPLAFYSWNDRLDPEIVQSQIRSLAAAGYGGFFMHARGGLRTEYLGSDWWKAVSAAVEAGSESGLQCWAYDERGWPSGFAGGLVPREHPEQRMKWIAVEERRAADMSATEELARIRRPEDGQIMAVVVREDPSYTDVLAPGAVDSFLDATHRTYAERFESGDVRGFFTDEPQYARGRVPWSSALEQAFSRRYGYDLIPHLVDLFYDSPGCHPIRRDFWKLVNELLCESYGGRIHSWCQDRHFLTTGHLMGEDSLIEQMSGNAGVMSFYEYLDIPGIDWLGRMIGPPLSPRQASSVAAQLGDARVLCETFALSGWSVSFGDLRRIADWLYAHGVNTLCLHLSAYSLQGSRKRDYPPSFLDHDARWPLFRHFTDRYARITTLLAKGEEIAPLLVVHPIGSARLYSSEESLGTLRNLDTRLEAMTLALEAAGVGWHFGDERLLDRHGSVQGDRLRVGHREYKAVILPFTEVLESTTIKLLERAIDAGCPVYTVGECPREENGRPSARAVALAARMTSLGEGPEDMDLTPILALFPWTLVRTGSARLAFRSVQTDGRFILFAANLDTSRATRIRWDIREVGSGAEYDSEANVFRPAPGAVSTDGYALDFELQGGHSRVFAVGFGEVTPQRTSRPSTVIRPKGPWRIRSADENALTLEYCRIGVDGGPLGPLIPVLQAQKELLALRRACAVVVEFIFNCEAPPSSARLAVELPSAFRLSANGVELHPDGGYWKDRAFPTYRLDGLLQWGVNRVILEGLFSQDESCYRILLDPGIFESELNMLTLEVELESLYLIGSFGVVSETLWREEDDGTLRTDGPFRIVEGPRELPDGDAVRGGYPFYSERMELETDFEVTSIDPEVRYELELSPSGPIDMEVNGQATGAMVWEPWKVDVTDCIRRGRNLLRVNLYGNNRNLLGPHHHVDGDCLSVGPTSFTDRGGWADGGRVDIWREGWSFAPFGMG